VLACMVAGYYVRGFGQAVTSKGELGARRGVVIDDLKFAQIAR
jgi:hypothetical protein